MLRRRGFHRLILTALVGVSAMPRAFAQGSGKVLKIVVGFPAGQATDQVARLVAERIQSGLGDPVIVENRPGQGGSLALAQVAKAPADGSVLTLSALAGYVVNPYLYRNVTYDAARDFVPVGMVADLPMILVVNPSLPVSTLAELLQYAKANPEKLSNASSGNGTLSHLLMEDLKRRAGVQMLHVPYQGSPPAMVDLMGGRVQVGLDTATVTLPQVRAGKLKVIAVGSARRLTELPNVPTIAESGFPGFDAVAWIALSAPAGTPAGWRERVHSVLNQSLGNPEFVEKLRLIGAVPRPMALAELSALIQAEQQRWRRVVKESGVHID